MAEKRKKLGFDQVLSAFSAGKVIHEDVTLRQIAEVSKKLEGDFGGELAAWTFISPNYVYKGDDEVNQEINISR